jgi:hypothetical protein
MRKQRIIVFISMYLSGKQHFDVFVVNEF